MELKMLNSLRTKLALMETFRKEGFAGEPMYPQYLNQVSSRGSKGDVLREYMMSRANVDPLDRYTFMRGNYRQLNEPGLDQLLSMATNRGPNGVWPTYPINQEGLSAMNEGARIGANKDIALTQTPPRRTRSRGPKG